ncbi:MAG TPA: hypothetical protein VFX96_03710 [Pyrinomonadaceae bacterium]|nr:hypothetical protein [Pyrinomonadaceae bacterium]
MRKHLFILTLAALSLVATTVQNASAQTATGATAATRPAQGQHLIGEVTALDAAGARVVIKTDAGATQAVLVDEKTVYRRVPPGETSLDKAERITAGDLKVGDRVLVPGGATLAEGAAARQVIVMAREAVATRREQERDDWRQRGMNGRVMSLDPAKREITVETRTREGAQTVVITPSASARLLRYAPDSLRPADAQPAAFTDIRVGDQLRARGERAADGSRLAAEEVITGSVARVSGRVESVDAARGELVVRGEQNEQTYTVTVGQRTTLRRIPRETLEELAKMRDERRARRGESGDGAARAEGGERRGRRGEGGRRGDGERRAEGERRGDGQRRGGGRNFQQMFENLPAVTLAELKKGDAVVVTGTTAEDASRVTAASLVTGDAEFFRLLQRFGRGPGGGGPMSPGLPGDVIGGNTGGRDQPQQPPRQ